MDKIRNEKRPRRNNSFEVSFSDEAERFLERIMRPPIGETSIAQKLDAILAMQEQFSVRLGLLETRAENIHGLVFDLVSADPETIKQLAASVKAAREKLQTSIDNQQKGD